MPNTEYSVKDILRAVGRAFGRVATELGPADGSPAYILVLLRRLGWNVGLDTTVRGAATTAIEAAEAIHDLLVEDDPDLIGLASAITEAISSMATVSDELDLVASAEFRAELARDLPPQLLDFLIIRFLETEHPRVHAMLAALGVIYSGHREPDSPHRIPYIHKEVRWDVLRGMFSEPAQVPTHAFGWDTPDFDGSRLLDAVELICNSFELETSRFAPLRGLTGVPTVGTDALFFQFLEWPELSIGAELYKLRNEADDADIGFALAPYLASAAEIELPLSESLSVGVAGALQLRREIGLEVTPNGLSVFGVGALPPPTGQVKLSLIVAPPDGLLTIGDRAGTHFTIPKCRLSIPINITSGQADLGLELVLEQTQLVIASSGADSFVGKILGDKRIEGRFELGLGVDRARGLYLIGSGGFEVEIPLHRSIGPLTIESIFVGVALDGGRVLVSLAASISAELGPVAASVTHIGVQIITDTEDSPEADLEIGPLHLGANFLPPTGGGLALAAGPITGGGFVRHDKAAGSYSGILNLKFGEIGLVAVAIITTKLPGGKKGFALFINIGVTFSPPITLPYLFTLQGCGGLCAVNRTMDTEALRSGLRNKTLDSILFPEDPILNANKIISDSERVFPIDEGRYVFGPMVKLGWGAGGIITANIAIVIELPAPLVIALLGQFKARVPQSEEAKIKLNLDVLGVLEIEKKSLSFDASLYDSKILVYELYGDSAMRLRWGSKPQFALSVGGFHPKFNPPPNFPSLRRLTLALSSGSSFELSCTVYHALTSNTLQFGAKLRIHAEACGAELNGHLGFDTLFQFSPFEFDVGISGGVGASYKGHNIASVYLSFDLSGPTPWHAKGKAKVSVLCWDVTARFNKTWGSDNKARTAKVDPLPFFLDEIKAVGNWGAALSPRRTIVESLKSLELTPAPPPETASETDTGTPATPDLNKPHFVVHPAGALEFRQRLLPLDLKLEKFKNVDVKSNSRFDVSIALGPETAAEPETTDAADLCRPQIAEVITIEVKEHFARGQFKDLKKKDRLSKPSYEKFRAGIQVGPSGARIDGCVQECELEYESILVLPDGVRERTTTGLPLALMRRTLGAAALRRSSLRYQRMGKFGTGEPPRVGLDDERYSVVDKVTLRRAEHIHPLSAAPINQTQAEDLVAAAIADHLVAPDSVIVVPEFEEVA